MNHDHYMSLALSLAEQGCNGVSPNPMVGCVIVKDNEIIGTGFHQKAGSDHAEVIALKNAGKQAQNATMYVTLEPCAHFGRTPPCVNAIIAAGISEVWVACKDLNPLVNQKGIELLRSAGITVHVGLCEEKARNLNKIFFHYIKNRTPYVIAKWAMSLDGKTITHSNDDKQLSCGDSQKKLHDFRQTVDAILVGANTAINDNPFLTARLSDDIKKQPIRIILCGHKPFSPNLNIFHCAKTKTILVVTEKTKSLFEMHESDSVQLLVVNENNGNSDIPSLLTELGKLSITSLLVEGGEGVRNAFFMEDAVNEVQIYFTPKIISVLPEKKTIFINECEKVGSDFYFAGVVKNV